MLQHIDDVPLGQVWMPIPHLKVVKKLTKLVRYEKLFNLFHLNPVKHFYINLFVKDIPVSAYRYR